MKKHKSKKYQSVIVKRIKRSVERLTMAVFILVVFAGMMQVGGTNAGFSDVETSTGNIFSASSLDGRATYVELFSVTGMNPEQSPDQRITFSNVGRLDFRYSIKYRKTGGDDVLCNAFLLTAERNGTEVYTGLLKDFDMNQFPSPVGSPFQIARFGNNNWDFTVELPAGAGSTLEHKTCQWDFDFTAWQTNLLSPTGGFVDEESVGTHSIATGEWLTAGDVVINEVMWMGSTVSSADEWIELKNMTGEDILLEGWKIENAGNSPTTITLPSGAFIPANGYYLVANYDKTSGSSALNVVPDLFTTNVELNNSGNGNLILKNNAATPLVIDSTLGTPVWPAGTNATFNQSMERNDTPGNGLLPGSWHTCVAGTCNDGIYWDTPDGNNFGTPGAANLSPIVLNEFVPNPLGEDDAVRPAGEWIELYNILDTPIDVSGWYFTNNDDDKITITAENTASGETLVPGDGRLVVYLEQAFLDNDADTLSLYAPGVLSLDESDDVREDIVAYAGAGAFPEGKSFARFPDGEGIWLDPEATPGEENELNTEEVRTLQLFTYGACFANEKLKKDNTDEICSPIFLAYIGMLDEADDTKINDSVLLDILEMIRLEEEKKLLALFGEDGTLTPEELATVPVTETQEDIVETLVEDEELAEPETVADEPVLGEETAPPAGEEPVIPEEVVPSEEPTPAETVIPAEEVAVPEEEVTVPPEEPAVEEAPADEAVPVEEAPVDEPETAPIIEAPVN